jgi:hypothetical protein
MQAVRITLAGADIDTTAGTLTGRHRPQHHCGGEPRYRQRQREPRYYPGRGRRRHQRRDADRRHRPGHHRSVHPGFRQPHRRNDLTLRGNSVDTTRGTLTAGNDLLVNSGHDPGAGRRQCRPQRHSGQSADIETTSLALRAAGRDLTPHRPQPPEPPAI